MHMGSNIGRLGLTERSCAVKSVLYDNTRELKGL